MELSDYQKFIKDADITPYQTFTKAAKLLVTIDKHERADIIQEAACNIDLYELLELALKPDNDEVIITLRLAIVKAFNKSIQYNLDIIDDILNPNKYACEV